ncbi:phosphoglycerate dehydrogenase [Carnobacterium viridans]|uniref:Phosphoglycerate dehydrogenase n=1 Tax=Carnobacterium viridans TaxID=174587 RepID=A0A1H0Z3E3_9LACT|nr:phosphoglycerate dehydrogenase [Carnobacterium viridans]SDQ21671.1 Phosphoglycerate dehydrogenase [Carnobacterium viridans]
MTKKSILLIQETTTEQLQALKELAPEYELIKGWETDWEDISLESIEIIYGWTGQYSKELVENEKSHLKWAQGKAAGVDFLDLEKLKQKNILLTNGSGIHSVPIAESVFGILLAYARGIQKAVKDQQTKTWDQVDELMELHGKTIMIVGTGKIGVEVGRLAKAFNMKTIGVNRSGRDVEYMDQLIKQPELVDQVKQADIVINILPHTDKTHYFFNQDTFSQMKEGTLFVNVGRGPTVKTDDLIAALDNGQLAFAGLDVFETEPLPEESALWNREDVLITPHITGIAEQFKKRLFAIFEENLKAYLAEEKLPVNLIDYDQQY